MSISTSEAEKLFGLDSFYSVSDVDKAFKRFAKKYHPDVCQSYGVDAKTANEMMLKATEARELLKMIADSDEDWCYEPVTENVYQPSPAPESEPACQYESPVENKAAAVAKEEHPFIQAVFNAIYNSDHVCGSGTFSFLLLILGWTLPFYLLGGLNLFPEWEGVLPLDGWSFLIGYLIVPVVSLLNLLSPIHFINMLMRGVMMIVFFPAKKALSY